MRTRRVCVLAEYAYSPRLVLAEILYSPRLVISPRWFVLDRVQYSPRSLDLDEFWYLSFGLAAGFKFARGRSRVGRPLDGGRGALVGGASLGYAYPWS